MKEIYKKTQEIENRGIVKLILFLVITFTLLPIFQYLNQKSNSILTYTFFGLFFLESIFRFILLVWSIKSHIKGEFTVPVSRKTIRADTVFWLIDLLATISFLEFLPFGNAFRFLRLLRLIKLSRYFSSFFTELGQILHRRSIRRQFVIVFVLLIAISIIVGLIFYVAEKGDIIEYTWWSFKTLFDPGELVTIQNDDEGSANLTKAVFSLGLTIIGLLILSFFIGIGTQVVENLVEITKDKKLNYKGHIIIFGYTRGTELMLGEIFKILEDNQILKKLVLLQNVNKELEDTMELSFKELTSRYYQQNTSQALRNVGIENADTIVIFGETTTDKNDDSDIIKKILSVREVENPKLYIVALIKDERNRVPAKEVGADSVIVRDSVLGFYMCQNMLKPELKDFYNEVLTSEGSEFYTLKLNTTKLANIEGKISYYSLYMELLKYKTTLVGIIKKKDKWIEEKQSPFDTSDELFVVNPLQYYDTEHNKLTYIDEFNPEEIEAIVCLTNNSITLYNSIQEINTNKLYKNIDILVNEYDVIPEYMIKTKDKYEEDKHSVGKILIIGWNESVPPLIQQLSSYVSVSKGITIYLHIEYDYDDESISLMRKKIRDLLSLYYSNEIVNLISNSINFVVGDYFSQSDLFDEKRAYIQDKETIVVVPDKKRASNPDADIFLVLLTLLNIIKNYENREFIQYFDEFKIYAQVSNDRVGNKLDEILEKVNPQVKSTTGKGSNIIDRFNIIYSEKILNYILIQHLSNKYTQKIFHSIMTNDDMNSIIILSENFIKDTAELSKNIDDKGKISYELICDYLLRHRITPVGYEYIISEDNTESSHIFINPYNEERKIDVSNNYPCIIVIGNYKNELIRKYDRNK